MALIINGYINQPPKKIFRKLKQPYDLLWIKTAHFIEMMQLSIDNETYEGFEYPTACFYREDWRKPFDPYEYAMTVEKIQKSSFEHALYGVMLQTALFAKIQEIYPELYKGEKVNDSNSSNVLSLKRGLSNNDLTKFEGIGNVPLYETLSLLHELKIEKLKKDAEVQFTQRGNQYSS